MHAGKVEILVILGGNPVYTPPPTSTSPPPSTRSGCACTSASTRTRPPSAATGTCPPRTPSESLERRARRRRHRHHPAAADRAALRRQVRARAPGRARWRDRRAAGYDIVREHWKQRDGGADFEKRWQQALHDGWCRAPRCPRSAVARSPGRVGRRPRRRDGRRRASRSSSAPTRPSSTAASPTTAGCRSCRKPLTKLTWDNAAIVSPAHREAARLAHVARTTAQGTVHRRGGARDRAAAACERRPGSCPGIPTAP